MTEQEQRRLAAEQAHAKASLFDELNGNPRTASENAWHDLSIRFDGSKLAVVLDKDAPREAAG